MDRPTFALHPPPDQADSVIKWLRERENVVWVHRDAPYKVQNAPDDPYFRSTGSWGQDYPDMWGLKRMGFTEGEDSAWNLVDEPEPVKVAFVDTGLDWNHAEISWDSIWRNEDEKPNNGVDDDGNGYVDDAVGWNFIRRNDTPWDHNGHGTFTTGQVIARRDNGRGIAGVNPSAKVMILKAMDSFGNALSSHVAEAIQYAADNGARVINVSAGGKGLTRVIREAIEHAVDQGVLVVAAAGNEGVELEDWGPAGAEGVLTVATTNTEDKRPSFSNWGPQVDIAAPGVDILSLRANRTDLMLGIEGAEYEARAAVVGEDARYYRTSGTSFSAPYVTGVASLLFADDPDRSAEEVKRMILQSARDIDVKGIDQHTGYGLIDARAALQFDPDFQLSAGISGVSVVRGNQVMLRIKGTVRSNDLAARWIEIGTGDDPEEFKRVTPKKEDTVPGDKLFDIPAKHFRGAQKWTLRLVAKHANGRTREARFTLNLK